MQKTGRFKTASKSNFNKCWHKCTVRNRVAFRGCQTLPGESPGNSLLVAFWGFDQLLGLSLPKPGGRQFARHQVSAQIQVTPCTQTGIRHRPGDCSNEICA
jgi:hypothetical protein